MNAFVKGLIVPGIPHPLLAPDQNPGWQQLADGFAAAREELHAAKPDVLLIYSTMWPSVIGHQIQAHPEPEWVHVDELFHALGSIPYKFRIDTEFAHAYQKAATARNLHARTVAYDGFPIDTGSVVALKLLNPNNEIPACIVSSNMYADRAETIVLGKAANDALLDQGKTAAAVSVMTLSNRLFTDWIEPHEDRIHSGKDEEWNQKLLEFLADGRLEDCAQLSREIHRQIRIKKVVNFKPFWWLTSAMGAHNRYEGKVHAYAPLFGTGGAVVSLTPSPHGIGDKEFDEDDVEVYGGDRNVLNTAQTAASDVPAATQPTPAAAPKTTTAPPAAGTVRTNKAPAPVGAYPHARQVGDLLYLSGCGPRQPGTDAIPGGAIRDENGDPATYDIKAQTRAVIENIKVILEASGASLEDVIDVTAFLVDMDRDFKGYNEVYAEYFTDIQATRTTLAISALPTPIAVELKVIAKP